MSNKQQELMTQLVTAVYQSKGVTDRPLRTAIKTAVAPGSDQLEGDDSRIPAALRPYLNKVGRHAYKVTDRDIETLKSMGYSEEAIRVCALFNIINRLADAFEFDPMRDARPEMVTKAAKMLLKYGYKI